jgi:hypothetical protein
MPKITSDNLNPSNDSLMINAIHSTKETCTNDTANQGNYKYKGNSNKNLQSVKKLKPCCVQHQTDRNHQQGT